MTLFLALFTIPALFALAHAHDRLKSRHRLLDADSANLWVDAQVAGKDLAILRRDLDAAREDLHNLKANAQLALNGHGNRLVSLEDAGRVRSRQIERIERLADNDGDRIDRLERVAAACADALGALSPGPLP